jgi:hypothetical protein
MYWLKRVGTKLPSGSSNGLVEGEKTNSGKHRPLEDVPFIFLYYK